MPIWRKLLSGVKKVTPSTLGNIESMPNIKGLQLDYQEGVKTMTYYAYVHSSTYGIWYSVQITFKNVERLDGLNEDEIMQGYQPRPSLIDNEIQVRCSCNSYRFRFDQANRRVKAGTGARFPMYVRRSNRKPNNPRMIPGACKHVIELLDYLQKNNFIR